MECAHLKPTGLHALQPIGVKLALALPYLKNIVLALSKIICEYAAKDTGKLFMLGPGLHSRLKVAMHQLKENP